MRIRRVASFLFVCLAVSTSWAQPLGTAFTYQGRLKNGGSPANGSFDMDFKLYPVPAGGTLLASQTLPAVSVSDGLFTVQVDFGAGVFDGNQRWLDVTVAGTPLVPRQELTTAPNAQFALNASAAATATTATTATNATQLNGEPAAFYQSATNINSGTLADARLSSNIARLDTEQFFTDSQHFSARASFDAAGLPFEVESNGLVTNLNADLLDGLNSTAFLQSVPVPLTLSAASNAQVLLVQNPTNSSGAFAIHGEATGGLSIGNAGVVGQSAGLLGTGVFGMSTSTGTAGGFGVQGHAASPNGSGVFGNASATTGGNYGVHGKSSSNQGRGVYGEATAATGYTCGGYFESVSPVGFGVYGKTTGSGGGIGVFGESASEVGSGVYGWASAANGLTYGGQFRSDSGSGWGVYGVGGNIGVYGEAIAPGSQFGVYSNGNMGASGTKPFRIDHPDDPANKYLLHYAAESPDVINFYRGTVRLDAAGEAVVELPRYFAKINKTPSYQLTAVGAPMPMLHVADEIDEAALSAGATTGPGDAAPLCSFRIAGGAPGGRVSWRVDALRNDRWVRTHGAPVEVEKQDLEIGTYQHPELYGQPPEKGMNYDAARERTSPLAATPGASPD